MDTVLMVGFWTESQPVLCANRKTFSFRGQDKKWMSGKAHLCFTMHRESLLQKQSIQKEYREHCRNKYIIQRALQKQIYYTEEKNETGDEVCYKQVDCPECKGPGVINGQDGVVLFIRHGGTCIRVHYLRLRKQMQKKWINMLRQLIPKMTQTLNKKRRLLTVTQRTQKMLQMWNNKGWDKGSWQKWPLVCIMETQKVCVWSGRCLPVLV